MRGSCWRARGRQASHMSRTAVSRHVPPTSPTRRLRLHTSCGARQGGEGLQSAYCVPHPPPRWGPAGCQALWKVLGTQREAKPRQAFVEVTGEQAGGETQAKHDGRWALPWASAAEPPPGRGPFHVSQQTQHQTPASGRSSSPESPPKVSCLNPSSIGARMGSDGGFPEAMTSRTRALSPDWPEQECTPDGKGLGLAPPGVRNL